MDTFVVKTSEAELNVGVLGHGRPLLLINGLGGDLSMWEPLLAHLPDRQVIVFDAPGCGSSPALSGPRRMPALADIVVELLDALDLEQVDVLGYSWGGALAQELAHRAPERVRSLVLCATTPGMGGQPPAPWVFGAMATPLRYHFKGYQRFIAPLVYGAQLKRGGLVGRPPGLVGYLHQLYAISGWSSLPWLRTLLLPVLVLTGRGDQLVPAYNGVILARGIPEAVLQEVEGGHLFLLQNAEVAAPLITSFLDSERCTA